MLEYCLAFFFPFFMAYAAASDMVSMTISNKISLALMSGFMIFAFLIGMNYETMLWHWGIFGIVLAAGFVLFAIGVVGGGDAKLAACTALWLGPEHSMSYFTVSALLGAFLTLFLMRIRYQPLPDKIVNVEWIARLYRADSGIPYGIVLGIGAILVYPQTPWMQYVFKSAATL